MNAKQSLFFKLLLLLIFLPFDAAEASERLSFSGQLSERSRHLLERYTAEQIKTDFHSLKIAKADLNEDNLDEYILRTDDCEEASSACTYLVLAEADDQIIQIGKFRAREVMLGNGYSSGIRNIAVLENQNSDFDYKLYVWEPAQSQYIMSR